MDGKAKKYILFYTFRGGGGGGSGFIGHGPSLTGKFFYSYILRPMLCKSAVLLSLHDKLKRLIPLILLSLMFSFQKNIPKKESCIYSSTVQK